MNGLPNSDALFTTFMTSLVITIILITSGAGMGIPQRYNVSKRAYMRDDAQHDTYKLSMKNKSRLAEKPSLWNIILGVMVLVTLGSFVLFLMVEFILN
jgi:hypothetical protein